MKFTTRPRRPRRTPTRHRRDRFDALDSGRRNRVDADGHRCVDRHRPIAVEQHEVSIRTEAAQAQSAWLGVRVEPVAIWSLNPPASPTPVEKLPTAGTKDGNWLTTDSMPTTTTPQTEPSRLSESGCSPRDRGGRYENR
jgi:hypothetical protein